MPPRVEIRPDAQPVELELPALSQPATQLRLDLGDCPGFLRLHELAVISRVGETIWSWNGDPRDFTLRHDLAFFASQGKAAWLSTSYDPFLQIPLLPAALERLSGARIRVALSWPLSADHALAASALTQESERWTTSFGAVTGRLTKLEAGALSQSGALLTLSEESGLQDQKTKRLDQRLMGLAEQLVALRDSGRDSQQSVQQLGAELRQEVEGLGQARAALQQQAALIQTLLLRLAELESPRGLRKLLRRGRAALLRPVISLRPIPNDQLRGAGSEWESVGEAPAFELAAARLPSGWVRLEIQLEMAVSPATSPRLYAHGGEGYNQANRLLLPAPRAGFIRAILKLPVAVRGLRLAPFDGPGHFKLGWLHAQEISALEARFRLAKSAD